VGEGTGDVMPTIIDQQFRHRRPREYLRTDNLFDNLNTFVIPPILKDSSKLEPIPTATPLPTPPTSSGDASQLETHIARGQSLPHRMKHLGLVLWVSLSMPIAGSVYYLFGGTAPTTPMQQHFRLVAALITESTSLTVLWYVMSRQGRTWKDIGWKLEFADVPRAMGLLIAATVLTYLVLIPIQYSYRAYSGRFLVPKSLNSMFGFGVSFLSIAVICLNPFFEELIVRAYTMSEVMNLGGNRRLAVIVSVVLQMSYHLYQGVENAIALTLLFTAFSIYYIRTGRIMAVILAHLGLDLLALIHGTF
jgi:membrane protease YdiL (CAAX protease family)